MSDASTERTEIVRVLDLYATTLDSREWVLLREVFTANAAVNFGEGPTCDVGEVIDAIRGFLDGCGPTQHLQGNYRVDIDGDTASSRCYIRAFHLGKDLHTGETYEMAGEYIDTLVRTADGWRISERSFSIFWELGNKDLLGPGSDSEE